MPKGSMSCWSRGKKRDVDEDENLTPPPQQPPGAHRASSSSGSNDSTSFTFSQLETATEGFSNMIGKGGFGKVYRGRLHDGQEIAVKRLDPDSRQGHREFTAEVTMLKKLHHPNLVKLIGYCDEGDHRLLVYEYMPNGSLADRVHGRKSLADHLCGAVLDWNTRMKIAVGVARGLKYLHCSEVPVIFRDLKPANVLLDSDFNPKLSDFGIARAGPTGDQTHILTRVVGTYGYVAPEYAVNGILTTKSDIYSFGVLLLELISGRKAQDEDLVKWCREVVRRGTFTDILDAGLRDQAPNPERLLGMIALLTVPRPTDRLDISEIVVLLERLLPESGASSSTAH